MGLRDANASKNYVADFSVLNEHFSLLNFWKSHSYPKTFVPDFFISQKRNIGFRNEGGGGEFIKIL